MLKYANKIFFPTTVFHGIKENVLTLREIKDYARIFNFRKTKEWQKVHRTVSVKSLHNEIQDTHRKPRVQEPRQHTYVSTTFWRYLSPTIAVCFCIQWPKKKKTITIIIIIINTTTSNNCPPSQPHDRQEGNGASLVLTWRRNGCVAARLYENQR